MTTKTHPAKRLFTRILPSSKEPRRPSADIVRRRIYEAEITAREAEHAWRAAIMAREAGGSPDVEETAEAHLMVARRDLARLEALLLEVEARTADEARAAQAAKEAAEDAEVVKAFEAWAKAAHGIEPALAGYVAAWRALVEAGVHVRSLAQTNPRVRQGLAGQPMAALVSVELARVSNGRLSPPGADRWAGAARNPAEITPLATHFNSLASAVREGLRHD